MAIIGGKFKQYVEDQIKQRQKMLGGDVMTDPTLKAINTKTPWIRLASSVDITKGSPNLPGKSVYEQIQDKNIFEGFNWEEDNLAKNFVLFGGVNNNVGGVNNMPNSNTGNPLQKAYGFGYNSLITKNNRGPIPLPGIQSVDFSYKNDGALAQASVKVKCFSPEQFQMIDILFQRPGYTVLLEFGHSVFKDNEGKLQYAGQGKYSYSTKPFNNLFKNRESNKGLFSLVDIIKTEKVKWDGNYEAFYAKITKFNWSFNMDGSYDITVNLIGLGDVIGSLKMDTNPVSVKILPPKEVEIDPNKLDANAKNNPETATEISFADYAKAYQESTGKEDFLGTPTFTSKDGRYIYSYIDAEGQKNITNGYYKTDSKKYQEETFTLSENATIQNSLTSTFTYELSRIKEEMGVKMDENGNTNDLTSTYISPTPYPHIQSPPETRSQLPSNTLIVNKKAVIHHGVLGVKTGNKDHDPGTYISFGVLLSIIQQFCNQYSKGVPLIQFDFNFLDMRKDTNYIRKYDGLFSSSPDKILIPYGQIPSNLVGDSKPLTQRKENAKQGKSFNSVLRKTPFFIKGNSNKGRLAYVFLHTDYLSTKFVEKTDSDEGVEILDFLKDVLKDINSNLNNLNSFKVLHNKETNKIEIVSEVPIDNTQLNLTTFNTFGVNKTEGSFIRNLSLDSELSDNYATQISVGAQNNGLNSQSNSLSFSTYNKGLIDRIIPEKTDKGDTKLDEKTNATGSKGIQTWGDIWTKETKSVFESVYASYNIDSETLSSLKNLNLNISRFVSGELTKRSLAPPPVFLPFNLKLEMDGLSGMQIYNSFQIDGKALPLTYNPKEIELTIKSLSHTVDSNGWITKVETFSRPKFTYDSSKIEVGEVPFDSPSNIPGIVTNNLTKPFEGPTPNADALRKVLTTLGYIEKTTKNGGEISNGGDITQPASKMAISVLSKIKEIYPDLSIRVTGGNDLFHQKLSYNSRHKAGRGIDFTITSPKPQDIKNVETILQGFAAGNNLQFRYINEYANPTKAASGKHFHISWGLGTEGQTALEKSIELAKNKKITTYKV